MTELTNDLLAFLLTVGVIAVVVLVALGPSMLRGRGQKGNATCPSCGGDRGEHLYHGYSGPEWLCLDEQKQKEHT